jgi:hypothetical protein
MSDDRWRRVEELYHAAMELSPEQRAGFLGDRAGGDSGLRREVESLLAQHYMRAWPQLIGRASYTAT